MSNGSDCLCWANFSPSRWLMDVSAKQYAQIETFLQIVSVLCVMSNCKQINIIINHLVQQVIDEMDIKMSIYTRKLPL